MTTPRQQVDDEFSLLVSYLRQRGIKDTMVFVQLERAKGIVEAVLKKSDVL